MKGKDVNANDDLVSSALRDWKVTATLPPRFNEQVWRRIEAADASPGTLWQTIALRIESVFAKRATALGYMAALIALGIGLGFAQAERKSSDVQSMLRSRYVQAIDPYQRGH